MKNTIKRAFMVAVTAIVLVSLGGCMTHEHIVGTGAATGYTESSKQWFLLYGLIPLGNVDTKAMAGGAPDYKIVTQTTIIDAIISNITVGLLIPRTVKVIK